MSMYSGGTLEGQHQRTVDMLEDKARAGDLVHLLWLLYDSQTTYEDLKRLAEIAQTRAPRHKEPPAPRPAREYLLDLYLDWRNNYLTVEVFAEHHGLTTGEACTLIDLARDVNRHEHPEA